jgi:hypothetical protein
MTQPDIVLSTAEVRRHAKAIDQAADMCRDAASAARHIDLHDKVYGELCGRLASWILNPRQHSAVTTILNQAQATTDLADLLRMMADNIDAAEERAERRHQEAGSK